MSFRQSFGPVLFWRLFQLGTVALLAYACYRLASVPYRIDVDVYRLGADAWLHGRPLFGGGTVFHTDMGPDLPFMYPPLAAILLAPMAWVALPVASLAMTAITIFALIIAVMIVVTELDVWPASKAVPDPAWARRLFLTLAIVAVAALYMEPIRANFAFGQVNAILMTLVIADCVPSRTRWPRGLLVGLAIALKLTPAVFVLYFLMRKDRRAALTAVASFAAFTIVGFLFAWRDSVEYWTVTVHNTDRIGRALNTNQNISGTLERLSVGHSASAVIWALGSVAVLALSVWATRRLLRAGEPVLAVMCIGLLGLVVSPVSWSHHWVWMLPAVLTAGVVAYRRRSTARHIVALFIIVVAGIAVTAFPPFHLLPENHETTASWWRQIVGVSYMWWALAYIGVAGGISPSRKDANDSTAADDGERVPAVS